MTPLQTLLCREAVRARAYSPCADRADVQPAVRSPASPSSKAAASFQPSWHRGRPACIDAGWETVPAAVALVEGPVAPVAPVDSCSSRARPVEGVVVVAVLLREEGSASHRVIEFLRITSTTCRLSSSDGLGAPPLSRSERCFACVRLRTSFDSVIASCSCLESDCGDGWDNAAKRSTASEFP